MKDMIIIGAGPAGMTAAIYGLRAGKSVLVLDREGFGGQIINAAVIKNYPGYESISGIDLALAMHEQAGSLGAEFDFTRATGIYDQGNKKIVKTDSGEYEAKTVIIAAGARNRELGIDGEQRLKGAGVSYCAACDGDLFRGMTVAVIGGGNTALDDAEVLAGICRKVYLVHRRDRFRGNETTVKRLEEKDNVEFVLDTAPVKINGEQKVESLVVKSNGTGRERLLPVDGVFIAVGRAPEMQAFRNAAELDTEGYAAAGEDCHAKMPGVFVAGDCRRKKVRQLVTATSDGSVAALAAVDYINAHGRRT